MHRFQLSEGYKLDEGTLVGSHLLCLTFRCSNKFKPMKDFNKNKFLGKWYEVEKFYLMRDLVAKCVTVNYDKFDDGKIFVNHVYTNRL